MLAQHHQRAGPVAVVPLVAHLQHLGDDRLDVDAVRCRADRLLQHRAEHAAIQRSRSITSGPKAPYRSTLPRPSFSEQKALPPCTGSRKHDIHIDGEIDAGHRADGAVVVARVEGDRRRAASSRSALLGARRPAPRTAARRSSAPRIGPEARSQVSGGPACRNVPRSRPSTSEAGPDVDELGAGGAAAAQTAVRLASSRRGSAMTRARSASVPPIGGRQSTVVTWAPCSRRASAKRSTPAVTTAGSRESSPAGGWWSASWKDLQAEAGASRDRAWRVACGVREEHRGTGGGEGVGLAVQPLRVALRAGERDDHRQLAASSAARATAAVIAAASSSAGSGWAP